MKNGLEIERRWLLGMLPDPNRAVTTYDILQFYGMHPTPDGEKPFRVRAQSENGKMKYFFTEKERTGPITTIEIESEISLDVFDAWLESCTSKISKARFVFAHADLKFEVDLYRGLRLIVLEVELTNEDQHVEIPDFIQRCIITEISGNDAFSNFKLSQLKK
jgi:CYTH domain-containing protein